MPGLGVVTGGARGIGLGIVRALLGQGVVDEVAVLDLDPEELSEAKVYACDVTDETSVREAFDGIGVVPRVLVNNAGGGRMDPTRTDLTPFDPFGPIDIWRDQIDLNLTAAYVVTREIGPRLEPGAAICNTASIAGIMPGPLFAYGAAKAGLIHWTKSMALELAPRGIRVNAVAPGPIWTPLIPASFPAEQVASFGQNTPLGRPGQPDEVAPCYVFLASDDARYLTGQVLHPNGGQIVGS